jgi:hypothetical protein
MNIQRLTILLSLLGTGCPGVWSGDWQDWLDENGLDTGDSLPETACATDPGDCDGYTAADGDCDDSDPSIHPGAEEVPYDGIDQDCDGADLTDVDGDGFEGSEVGGDDCDDTRADVNPDAMELPCNDVDEDCDTTMVQDGMTASFAASGMEPSSVRLDWDPVGGRVLAFFGAEDDGSCSADTLRYRAFDEGLNLLVDQDITPAEGLGTGATVAPVVASDGQPRLVAYSSCDGSLLLLEPVSGDDGDWRASTMADAGLGSVTAVSACSPDGDALLVAYAAGSDLAVAKPDGDGWSWTDRQAGAGRWSGLDLACASPEAAQLSSVDGDGLQAMAYNAGTGVIAAPESVHAGASVVQGGSGPGGEPWVLFFEDPGADMLGYAWQEAQGAGFDLTAIGGVGAGTGLASSGVAAGSDGHALLALVDDSGFHLRRIELSTGQVATWSDTSLDRSYADVVVDDQQRAWYLYGSADAYKVGVLCPE